MDDRVGDACRARIYQVDGAIVRPLPLQDGGIPFWIAGGGEQVTLRIAAKYAQYTNFDGTPEAFRAQVRGARRPLRATSGRDFDSITRSANYNIAIGETEQEVQDRLDWFRDKLTRLAGADRADRQLRPFVGMPGVGTPEQIVEKLSPRCGAVDSRTRSATSPTSPTTPPVSICSRSG